MRLLPCAFFTRSWLLEWLLRPCSLTGFRGLKSFKSIHPFTSSSGTCLTRTACVGPSLATQVRFQLLPYVIVFLIHDLARGIVDLSKNYLKIISDNAHATFTASNGGFTTTNGGSIIRFYANTLFSSFYKTSFVCRT